MKTNQQWFEAYAESHQHPLNIRIHFICVPVIYFSCVGLLLSIPHKHLVDFLNLDAPLLVNWAVLGLIPVHIFYLKLSLGSFIKMAALSAACLFLNFYIAQLLPLHIVAITLFILAWIGQFYGHHIEGKKPSFIKDLQFLLIGPLWVIEKITKR